MANAPAEGGAEKNQNFFDFCIDIFLISAIIPFVAASVAHLVERHLAKVEVASSSLVSRSITILILEWYHSQAVRRGTATP